MRGEAAQCRLHLPISPLTSEAWLRYDQVETQEREQAAGRARTQDAVTLGDYHVTEIERPLVANHVELYRILAEDQAWTGQKEDNVYLFPNQMAPETAAQLPMTVIFTSEFDIYRRASEELRGLLEAEGRLADYCCHPGTYHCSWTTYDLDNTAMFFDDFRKAIATYLTA